MSNPSTSIMAITQGNDSTPNPSASIMAITQGNTSNIDLHRYYSDIMDKVSLSLKEDPIIKNSIIVHYEKGDTISITLGSDQKLEKKLELLLYSMEDYGVDVDLIEGCTNRLLKQDDKENNFFITIKDKETDEYVYSTYVKFAVGVAN